MFEVEYTDFSGELYVKKEIYDEVLYRAKEAKIKIETLENEITQLCNSRESFIDDPIAATQFLISHTTLLEGWTDILGVKHPEQEISTFDIDDLEQIAEHLLVYCKHNRGTE